jgi:hypothetical protein
MKTTTALLVAMGLFIVLRQGPAQIPLGSNVVHWYLDVTAQAISDCVFQLPEAPTEVMIFRNGMRLKDCRNATGACDYSVSGDQVTFTNDPMPDDLLIFDYIK